MKNEITFTVEDAAEGVGREDQPEKSYIGPALHEDVQPGQPASRITERPGEAVRTGEDV